MARIQLALNVPDLAQAVAFSTSLFDAVTDDMPATAEPAGCCTA